jgi:hypothetical protein
MTEEKKKILPPPPRPDGLILITYRKEALERLRRLELLLADSPVGVASEPSEEVIEVRRRLLHGEVSVDQAFKEILDLHATQEEKQ